MPTLTGCMIIENEKDMIECSLTQAIKHCNKVIIVDGGSIDNTLSIANNVIDKFNARGKVTIYNKPFTHLNDQRNYYLERCETDFIMYLDADEIFSDKHMQKIKEDIHYYDLLLIRSWHFWHDFYHVAVGGGWDTSFMMPRVFRNLKGQLKYQAYQPKLGDHTLMVGEVYFKDFWRRKTRLYEKDELVCCHLGHAVSKEKMARKMKFFFKEDHPEIPEDEYDKKVEASSWFDARWFEGQFVDPDGVNKFEGEHPEIMKQHPRYNVRIIKD